MGWGGVGGHNFEIPSRPFWYFNVMRDFWPLIGLRAACSKNSHGHCSNVFPLHLKVKSGHFVQFDVPNPKML